MNDAIDAIVLPGDTAPEHSLLQAVEPRSLRQEGIHDNAFSSDYPGYLFVRDPQVCVNCSSVTTKRVCLVPIPLLFTIFCPLLQWSFKGAYK